MAERVHAKLKANGTDIKGESTQLSEGRKDSIECLSFEQYAVTPFEPSTGQVSGRRQHSPLKIIKRVDSSTPILWKAMTKNEKIEGDFLFFRPNPAGDGTTQQFYTVTITGGFIASIKQFINDTLAPGESYEPPREEITMVFHTIAWRYTPTGGEHQDDWAQS